MVLTLTFIINQQQIHQSPTYLFHINRHDQAQQQTHPWDDHILNLVFYFSIYQFRWMNIRLESVPTPDHFKQCHKHGMSRS